MKTPSLDEIIDGLSTATVSLTKDFLRGFRDQGTMPRQSWTETGIQVVEEISELLGGFEEFFPHYDEVSRKTYFESYYCNAQLTTFSSQTSIDYWQGSEESGGQWCVGSINFIEKSFVAWDEGYCDQQVKFTVKFSTNLLYFTKTFTEEQWLNAKEDVFWEILEEIEQASEA